MRNNSLGQAANNERTINTSIEGLSLQWASFWGAVLVLAAIAMMPVHAYADSSDKTVGDLSAVQSDTMLLKAKAAKEAAKADLEKSAASVTSSVGGATSGELPVVRSVYGVGGRLAASFLYPHGISVEGHVGDTIMGGYTVKTITIDKVELSKDRKVFPLGFSATPPVESTPPAAGPAMPPGMGGTYPMVPH